jgi:hypothetical protein
MADTVKLRDMLQDLINDRPEQAQVNLHDYLVDKMRDVAGTAAPEVEEVDKDDETGIDDELDTELDAD